MNIFNDLILMTIGFDLFVVYLVLEAIKFYRHN